jgi:SEC-C motif-containing protein
LLSAFGSEERVMTTCPCGTNLLFSECCGPIIGGSQAMTAEALMRARYTAFITKQIGDFLFETLAKEKQGDFDPKEVELSARDAHGLGFEVRAVNGGGIDDDVGTIEYVARFRIRDQVQIHHELASFRREDGRWIYVDGEVNPKGSPRQVVKVGRNDPCPCGSGQKYKKCCGA